MQPTASTKGQTSEGEDSGPRSLPSEPQKAAATRMTTARLAREPPL